MSPSFFGPQAAPSAFQAMLGMNLAGGLQAMGVEGAGHWAGRDKAPFRMLVGLPPAANPMERLGPDPGGPGGPGGAGEEDGTAYNSDSYGWPVCWMI